LIPVTESKGITLVPTPTEPTIFLIEVGSLNAKIDSSTVTVLEFTLLVSP
jgi:hypothetical protein